MTDARRGFNFASAIDRHYVIPYAAMLLSFRDKNPGTPASVFILHYDLVDDDLAFLGRVAELADVKLTISEIPPYPLLHFVVRKRIHLNPNKTMSPIAYAKSFLDRYLPQDLERVICIDADIIVAADMSEMLTMAFEEPLAAVPNLPRAHHHQFNSGFMLADLTRWRALEVSDTAERFLYEYSDSLFTHDQHTLNLIFRDNWHKLNLKWNYMEDFHRFAKNSRTFSRSEIDQARQSPTVIHYAVGTDKPWLATSQHPMANLYVKYATQAMRLAGTSSLARPGQVAA